MATTVCAIRSAIVGTPSARTPSPCGLGISTALTGGGKYDPELIRFQILYRLPCRSASNSSSVCPSTPAAPLLAATRRYVSHTIGLGIMNGLSSGFGMFAFASSQDHKTPVDRIDIPGEPAPWLHRHPQQAAASQLLRAGPPASAATGTQCLRFPPRHAPSRDLRGLRPRSTLSTLAFSRSVQEPQTRLTPPLRRTPPGQERGHPPGLSRGTCSKPRFRCHLENLRRLNSDPRPPPAAESFWHVFLVPT